MAKYRLEKLEKLLDAQARVKPIHDFITGQELEYRFHGRGSVDAVKFSAHTRLRLADEREVEIYGYSKSKSNTPYAAEIKTPNYRSVFVQFNELRVYGNDGDTSIVEQVNEVLSRQ